MGVQFRCSVRCGYFEVSQARESLFQTFNFRYPLEFRLAASGTPKSLTSKISRTYKIFVSLSLTCFASSAVDPSPWHVFNLCLGRMISISLYLQSLLTNRFVCDTIHQTVFVNLSLEFVCTSLFYVSSFKNKHALQISNVFSRLKSSLKALALVNIEVGEYSTTLSTISGVVVCGRRCAQSAGGMLWCDSYANSLHLTLCLVETQRRPLLPITHISCLHTDTRQTKHPPVCARYNTTHTFREEHVSS